MENWDEYKNWISNNMQNGYQYLFRGQENSQWKLQTTFHRINPPINLQLYLQNIIPEINNQLQSKGFEYHNLQDMHNYNSFLSKIQHHGFPTPLLDWTYSPYIAAYFAIKDIPISESLNGDFSIFIFDNIRWITTNYQPIDLNNPNQFLSTFKPYYANNPRLITQNSILTITNVVDIEDYLYQMGHSQGQTFLYKINIPRSEIPKIKNDLEAMGIHEKSLFPNLDEACREIKMNFFGS